MAKAPESNTTESPRRKLKRGEEMDTKKMGVPAGKDFVIDAVSRPFPVAQRGAGPAAPSATILGGA